MLAWMLCLCGAVEHGHYGDCFPLGTDVEDIGLGQNAQQLHQKQLSRQVDWPGPVGCCHQTRASERPTGLTTRTLDNGVVGAGTRLALQYISHTT